MLVNQKAIHRSMIAAATHEYINVFHIESQNHCIAVVFPPMFYIVVVIKRKPLQGKLPAHAVF